MEAILPRPVARTVLWVAWLTYLTLLTAALIGPAAVHAEPGTGKAEALFYASKLTHVGSYLLAGVLTAWLPTTFSWRRGLLGLLFLHGASTEFLQYCLPTGRIGTVRDVGLNFLGILLAVALTWKQWNGRESRVESRESE